MPVCTNCGSESVENYCPQCGQHFSNRLTLREFLREFAEDQLGVNGKFPRTLAALFLKPGLLTAEYVAGRRARYLPPFRLYLLASLLFFVLLSFLTRRSDWAERAEVEMRREMAADTSIRVTGADSANWINHVSVNLPWDWLDQKLETNIKALGQLPPSVAMRRVTDATLEELPKVMFVLLPLFALLLRVLYFRRMPFYIAHFVFALHLHTFAFTLFSLALILPSSWMLIALSIVLPVYTFAAMKRVYMQGVIMTAVKWATLGYVYFALLVVGLLFALTWALAAA